jgi:hypothetical protein
MRPAGEIRVALLDAARSARQNGRGFTMRELAARACVGRAAARKTIENMVRAGVLLESGELPVEYRNRPVKLYALPQPLVNETGAANVSAH